MKILNIFLQDEYEVSGFEKPEEELEAALTGDCPIIITDIRMPRMTGLEIIDSVEHER